MSSNIGYPDTVNRKGSSGPLLKTNPPTKTNPPSKEKTDDMVAPMPAKKPKPKEGLKTTIKDNTRKKPNMPPKMNYNLDVRKTPTIQQT